MIDRRRGEPAQRPRGPWREHGAVARFVLLHAGAAGVVLLTPWSWAAMAWLGGSYLVRMFGVTAGYHRYFSHRAYRIGRAGQFALACLAQTSGQKGVLWWAAHHRTHHRHADTPEDLHSPHRDGFFWSHVGWILSDRHVAYDEARVGDLAKYPELRWLDRHHWVPMAVFGGLLWMAGGATAFLWGFLVATMLVYHATFAINSVAHVWGTRRFATADESRNNWWLALLTLGEGWHNNHHYCRSSARQGWRWWEIDVTWLLLRALAAAGLVHGLRGFPAAPRRAS